MHRLFRKALDAAVGESKSVIVVNADVRGFSAFSMRCESPDTAVFIRRVYVKLIDSYFPFASFFKPTGDGLLLAFPFSERDLKEVSQKVISGCIACHSEFGSICSCDPMINFEVPDRIGIGVARGTACCLVSGRRTIDYSGRLLNLTSRLTNLARPSGIVIDEAFGIGLLSDEQQSIFQQEEVYLEGIAEAESIAIHFTTEFTVIQDYNKHPIISERWQEVSDVKTLEQLAKLEKFLFPLPSEPLNREAIKVKIKHDKIINGEVHPEYFSTFDYSRLEYSLDRGKPTVIVDYPSLCQILRDHAVKDDMKITITVAYMEKYS